MGDRARNRLAAIDATTGLASPDWDPDAGSRADAILTAGDAVYAGGRFRQLGSVMQQGFGSFTAAGASDSSGPSVSCPVDHTTVAVPPSNDSAGPVVTPPAKPARSHPLELKSFEVKPPRFRPMPAAATHGRSSAKGPAQKQKIPEGTAFLFELTTAANVRIRINRELFGRRHGKECVAPAHRRGHRCTRYQLYGTLASKAREGANSVAFSGRLRGKRLPTGIYTAKLIATDYSGKDSVSRLARFQVLGP
jgi:hypothetical protein